MERLADPRVYKCALQQSVEPADWILDPTMYTYCPSVKQVMTPETDAPFSSIDKCYAKRKSTCKCGDCKCSADCKC